MGGDLAVAVASKAATEARVSIGDAGGAAKLAEWLCVCLCPREEVTRALFLFLSRVLGGLRMVVVGGRRRFGSRFSSSAIASAASGIGSIAASMRSGVRGLGGGGALNSCLKELEAMAGVVRADPACVVAESGRYEWDWRGYAARISERLTLRCRSKHISR